MGHIYELKNTDTITSPSLIYYGEIIRENIKKTIRAVEGPERLWPHVEDHKSKDIVRVQMEYSITKSKAATVTEAEVAAEVGAEKAIPTYPLIGPNMERFVKPTGAYPDTVFCGMKDGLAQFEAPSGVCVERNTVLPILVDVDMGMSRTGAPIERLEGLYRFVSSLPGFRLCGMYCCDGNHNDRDAAVRQAQMDDTDKEVSDIMERLNRDGVCRELVMASGTPSSSCHAGAMRWYLSPGATFITDAGYYTNLPDLDFIPEAVVMTRVINHPTKGVFTTDLGYRAIVSDPARQRDYVVGLEDTAPIIHNEKHWAFWLEDEGRISAIGSYLYVIPTHICPTTALYPEVLVTKEGQATSRRQMTVRNRRITY